MDRLFGHGLTLILMALYFLFATLAELLRAATHDALIALEASYAGLSLADVPMALVSSTIIAGVAGVIPAALYVELRDLKDGPRTEALAEIFE